MHICCRCKSLATLYKEWFSVSRRVCCFDNIATVLMIKFHGVSQYVCRRGISRVAFLFDFQWTRRHVLLNGTKSEAISVEVSPNNSHVLPPDHDTCLIMWY